MKINLCLVNWCYEDEQLLEPYEWQDDDALEWLIQVPVLKVSKQMMKDCFESLLTFQYLNQGNYIICDGHRCLMIQIDSKHHLLKRSTLMYNTQSTILHHYQILPLYEDTYMIEDTQEIKEYGMTRNEKEKKQLLLCYLDLFDPSELNQLTSGDFDYIEQGYHLGHDYLYEQIEKLNKKA